MLSIISQCVRFLPALLKSPHWLKNWNGQGHALRKTNGPRGLRQAVICFCQSIPNTVCATKSEKGDQEKSSPEILFVQRQYLLQGSCLLELKYVWTKSLDTELKEHVEGNCAFKVGWFIWVTARNFWIRHVKGWTVHLLLRFLVSFTFGC